MSGTPFRRGTSFCATEVRDGEEFDLAVKRAGDKCEVQLFGEAEEHEGGAWIYNYGFQGLYSQAPRQGPGTPGVRLGYEAAVGGGIPVIRALQTSVVSADTVHSVAGILNGTTNFMLTKMAAEGASYAAVLKEAQAPEA